MQEEEILSKSHGKMSSSKQSDYFVKIKTRLHKVALPIPSNSKQTLIQEAHEPYRSPEKTVQINYHYVD